MALFTAPASTSPPRGLSSPRALWGRPGLLQQTGLVTLGFLLALGLQLVLNRGALTAPAPWPSASLGGLAGLNATALGGANATEGPSTPCAPVPCSELPCKPVPCAAPPPAPPARPARPHDRYLLPRRLYEAAQRDPSLLKQPAVAEAFLPTPWLLPAAAATRELLPYLGLHNDLDALLAVRAASVDSMAPAPPPGGISNDYGGAWGRSVGDVGPGPASGSGSGGSGAKMAISVVYFSVSHSEMMQNWVYTAVRWASITNYIVAAWEERSLAACLAMRLPCYNATSYSPVPMTGEEAQWRSKAFIPLSWIKPLLAADLVGRGYHVHSSDVDIAFPPKPFWPSMLRFLEPAGADVAMERDLWGPINTGCVVVRPTPYGKAWMQAWVENAKEDALKGVDDQERVMQLGDSAFRTCEAPWDCLNAANEREQAAQDTSKEAPKYALIRRYHPAWDAVFQDHCAGAHLDWVLPIDPCLPSHTNYHLVCITGSDNKKKGFKGAGLWFLDDEATAGCTQEPLSGLEPVPEEDLAQFVADFLQEAQRAQREEQAGTAQQQQGLLERQGGGQEGATSSGGSSAGAGAGRESKDEVAGMQRRQLLEGGAQPAASGQQPLQQQQQPAAGQQQAAAADAAAGQGGQSAQSVARCRPLHWRQPRAETWFSSCDRTQLAYSYYPPAGLFEELI